MAGVAVVAGHLAPAGARIVGLAVLLEHHLARRHPHRHDAGHRAVVRQEPVAAGRERRRDPGLGPFVTLAGDDEVDAPRPVEDPGPLVEGARHGHEPVERDEALRRQAGPGDGILGARGSGGGHAGMVQAGAGGEQSRAERPEGGLNRALVGRLHLPHRLDGTLRLTTTSDRVRRASGRCRSIRCMSVQQRDRPAAAPGVATSKHAAKSQRDRRVARRDRDRRVACVRLVQAAEASAGRGRRRPAGLEVDRAPVDRHGGLAEDLGERRVRVRRRPDLPGRRLEREARATPRR